MSVKRVLLGMSGGTDSSVSALLLKEAGYEVTGVTFRFLSSNFDSSLADAAEMAERVGISHFVYDATEIFQEKIITYFIDEYLQGKTPVPCVLCNNWLKWPLLAKLADERGIEYIATGHYVQTECVDDHYYVTAGIDPDKDQSFFLWGLEQDILRRMVLPLGNMTKVAVRQLAEERGFRKISKKKDSLGVCFCPGDYRDFLKKNVTEQTFQPGNFVDSKGNFLGKHAGFPFYTVGQRRGLGLNLNEAVFVKNIQPETNTIVLSPLDELYKSEICLRDVNYVRLDDFAGEVICRVRYRKQSARCTVEFLPDRRAIVRLIDREHSLAEGQSAVFYHENRVIGGGIIESSR